MDVTAGPSEDIKQATKQLWNMVHQLGMDPQGGVIERSGLGGDHRDDHGHREYFFEELPHEKVEALGKVIRDLENYLVMELLKAHDLEWYKSKITSFARQGVLTEIEFYDLIEQVFPGVNEVFLGQKFPFTQDSAQVTAAREFKIGNQQQTASQNLEKAMKEFQQFLEERLHSNACEKALSSR